MTLFDDTHAMERPVFFDGQQLYADDLQELAGFHQALRWLHNRSLHQPGIGNGFAVAGKRGDREVSIGPGYALDYLGREIVLRRVGDRARSSGRRRHRRRPGRVRHHRRPTRAPEDLDEAETREGICLAGRRRAPA